MTHFADKKSKMVDCPSLDRYPRNIALYLKYHSEISVVITIYYMIICLGHFDLHKSPSKEILVMAFE